jgi:hypothetical protein
MVVGIQPVPFQRFLKRRGIEAHDSGFTARFLIAVPPSTKGHRFIGAWQVSTDAIDRCCARLRELLDEAERRTLAGIPRTVLTMTPDAASLFVRAYNNVQQLMAPGRAYADISGQAAKAAENVARVAAVLHVIDGLEGDISEDTLTRAGVIVEWFVNQFLELFGAADVKPSLEHDAAAVENALFRARSCGHQAVLRSELKYWCPPEIYGTKFDRALHVLVAHQRAFLVPNKGKVWVTLPQSRYGALAW